MPLINFNKNYFVEVVQIHLIYHQELISKRRFSKAKIFSKHKILPAVSFINSMKVSIEYNFNCTII